MAPKSKDNKPEPDNTIEKKAGEEAPEARELTGEEIWAYLIRKTKEIPRSLRSSNGKNRIIEGPKSLRAQLVISIWAGLAVVFIPINIVYGIRESRVGAQDMQKKLLEQGGIVYFGVKSWKSNIKDLLGILAVAPPVRKLNQGETEEIFDTLAKLYPYRSWRLWNRDGDLLAGTNIEAPSSRAHAFTRPFFLKAREGIASNGIHNNCLSGKSCFVESVPVFEPGISPFSTKSAKPVGVLAVSINLEDTTKDSGLAIIKENIDGMMDKKGTRISKDSPWNSPLSLQNKDFTGMEVLMISKSGNVIFPMTTVNDTISLEQPEKIMAGPWGPIVKIGMKASNYGKFEEIKTGGRKYFLFSKRMDGNWSLVALSDKESTYQSVREKISEGIHLQLITLLSATVVIALVCRKAASPIKLAATTIKEFSSGNFESRIETNREDEIGSLFKDINQTGINLRRLLTNQIEHAATDQQIRTATNIQKSFVIQDLPINDYVELAADFDPAYEIGADWYDAISTEEITYVVIADVCDKGIASALFMSVFRSLLRYSLLDEDKEMKIQGLETSLKDAITQVNNYMATNHGESSMFATLFLGAYVKNTHKLSYICAGHEIPIIVRKKGELESLVTTGPAVGIFAEAKYEVKTVGLEPNQILFTYTDGLVDARSPSNISWGIEGVKGVLSNADPTERSAKSLLDEMSLKVNQHRDDAEQFDDLTMLVLKIK